MNTQNFNSTTTSTSQKPKKVANSRQSAAFNLNSIKKLNQNLQLKLERQKVQQELESVKVDTKSIFDDIPMMTFEDDPQAKGWKSIYLGLYSPYSNKYTAFMKHAIEKAKEHSNSPSKIRDQQRNGVQQAFGNNEAMPTFIQLMQLSQKSQNKRHGSIFSSNSHNAEGQVNKSDNNPPSRNMQEPQLEQLTQNQWQEQQEMQYILMFEGLSKHKRDIIEEQIRNGNQNLMAQKYLQLVQQKKLSRTLQDVFQVKKPAKSMLLKHEPINPSAFNKNKRKNSFKIDKQNLMTPQTEQEGMSDLFSQKSSLQQINNSNKKHQRALSLHEYNSKEKNQLANINKGQSKDITKMYRSNSASARIDTKIINKNNLSSRLQSQKFNKLQVQTQSSNIFRTQDLSNRVNTNKKEIIRRKSCECCFCGGETKKIPIAALYEEEEIELDIDFEEKETFSTGITLKFPSTQHTKPKAASIFKNLIGVINKNSPSNRQLKNSKTQANLFYDGFASANTLKPGDAKQKVDFFDKDKIIRKYKGTKQFGGLSPIFDIERIVKKKIGLNKSKIRNQQTQLNTKKIDLFSPNKHYKKLVTVDSDHEYIQSPKSSSLSETPESSTRKASQQKVVKNQFEGFLNLKTLQLPHSKDKGSFFHIRNKQEMLLSEIEEKSQNIDSKDNDTESNQNSQQLGNNDKSRNLPCFIILS